MAKAEGRAATAEAAAAEERERKCAAWAERRQLKHDIWNYQRAISSRDRKILKQAEALASAEGEAGMLVEEVEEAAVELATAKGALKDLLAARAKMDSPMQRELDQLVANCEGGAGGGFIDVRR